MKYYVSLSVCWALGIVTLSLMVLGLWAGIEGLLAPKNAVAMINGGSLVLIAAYFLGWEIMDRKWLKKEAERLGFR